MDISGVRTRLIMSTAQKLRRAVDKRNHQTADVIAAYDMAVAEGDPETIQATAFVMITMLAMNDPVRDVINQFAEVMNLIRNEED